MLETPLGATRLLQPQMRRSDLVVISLWWKQRCENPRSHTPHDGTARAAFGMRNLLICVVVLALALNSYAAVHEAHFSVTDGLTNRTVTLETGDILMCTFFGLLSTGFSWENKSHPEHLKFSGYLKQEVPPNNFIWNYSAVSAGTSKLIFTNGEPWIPTPADVVAVDVVVKDANITGRL